MYRKFATWHDDVHAIWRAQSLNGFSCTNWTWRTEWEFGCDEAIKLCQRSEREQVCVSSRITLPVDTCTCTSCTDTPTHLYAKNKTCVQVLQIRIMCNMACMLSTPTLHIRYEIYALFNIVNECNYYNNDANWLCIPLFATCEPVRLFLDFNPPQNWWIFWPARHLQVLATGALFEATNCGVLSFWGELWGPDVWCTDQLNVAAAATVVIWPLSCLAMGEMMGPEDWCNFSKD